MSLEAALTCLSFPAEHRGCIRTTNGVERPDWELKRRTRAARTFPNRTSLLRLATEQFLKPIYIWECGLR